jgi:hypothetical protein
MGCVFLHLFGLAVCDPAISNGGSSWRIDPKEAFYSRNHIKEWLIHEAEIQIGNLCEIQRPVG